MVLRIRSHLPFQSEWPFETEPTLYTICGSSGRLLSHLFENERILLIKHGDNPWVHPESNTSSETSHDHSCQSELSCSMLIEACLAPIPPENSWKDSQAFSHESDRIIIAARQLTGPIRDDTGCLRPCVDTLVRYKVMAWTVTEARGIQNRLRYTDSRDSQNEIWTACNRTLMRVMTDWLVAVCHSISADDERIAIQAIDAGILFCLEQICSFIDPEDDEISKCSRFQ